MITEEHAKPPPIAVPSQVNSSPNSFTFSTLLEKSRVVHNHPSGDPTPSRADIQMTETIVEIGKPLGIAVHDHLIIGRNGNASMKGLLLI